MTTKSARLERWASDLARGTPFGCLVFARGRIAGEWYGNGFSRHAIFEIGSLRKTFNSALVGRLIGSGSIDVHANAAEIYPEIVSISGDEADRLITLHQLMSGTSGWLTPDPPGKVYRYNNAACTMAERVVGRFLRCARDEIAGEIIRTFQVPLCASWRVYHFAHDFVPTDFREAGPKLAVDSTLADLALWGELWLNEGSWKGQRLFPASWARLAASRVNSGLEGAYYGYNWFVNPARVLWPQAPEDSFGHSGWGLFRPSGAECRAYLWICPSLGVVGAAVFDASTEFANDAVEVPNVLTAQWIAEVVEMAS